MKTARRRGRPPGANARHRTIAADISRRLILGEWPAGEPIPSYRSFAKSYAVGVATIRLAVRQLGKKGLVRVQAGRPSVALVKSGANSPTENAIGMIVNWYALADFTRDIWTGVARAAFNAHARVVAIQYLDAQEYMKPEGLELLRLRGILLPCGAPPQLLKHLESLPILVVLLDQTPMGFKIHSVTVDNYQTAFDSTAHLIALGHRRLAFVRSLVGRLRDIDPDSKERQTGFLAACKQFRIPPRDYTIFSANFDDTSPTPMQILSAEPPYTAVVTSSSTHAEQLARAAHNAGLRIPRDLSVETFATNSHSLSRNWSGPRIDLTHIGYTAVELINRKPVSIERVYVRAERQEGDSVARPRKGTG